MWCEIFWISHIIILSGIYSKAARQLACSSQAKQNLALIQFQVGTAG